MMDALKEYGWILFFPGWFFYIFAMFLPGSIQAPWTPPEHKIVFFMGVILIFLGTPWAAKKSKPIVMAFRRFVGRSIKRLVEEAEEQA